MKIITCWKCRCEYGMPDALYEAAHANSKIAFCCPYGHTAHYPDGETEEQKLHRENQRLIQRQAQLMDEASEATSRADKAERALTRHKKRAAAGTCPCCKRTFKQLASHMKQKHPDFGNVVELKKA